MQTPMSKSTLVLRVDRVLAGMGLTYAEAARRCDLSRERISYLARQPRSGVSLHTVARLADGLRVPWTHLIEEVPADAQA